MKDDIIQIIDETHPWYPSLLIVSEVKYWGVQAYVFIPHSNERYPVAHVYNRLKSDQYVVVGKAEIISE